MISLTKIGLLYTIKIFVIEQRQTNINGEKGESHDNYKKCIKFNDILLDIQTQSGTISQQPTANSQQPTANSQQPTANSQQPTANSQQPTANKCIK